MERMSDKKEGFLLCVYTFVCLIVLVMVIYAAYKNGYREGYKDGQTDLMDEVVANYCVQEEHEEVVVESAETVENNVPGDVVTENSCTGEATVNVAYDWEYLLSIIAMESGNDDETTKGICMCIQNACDDTLLNPCEVLVKYQYTKVGKTPSDSTRKIAEDVFINDVRYEEFGDADIFYSTSADFYSSWHESQEFICQVGVTRFFRMR